MDKVLDSLEDMRSAVAKSAENLRGTAIYSDFLADRYNDNSDFYTKTSNTLWGMEIALRKLEQELAELYFSIRVNSADERVA